MERGPSITVPRGRHAPPLEVRLGVQRTRLLEAAAQVFARMGYADASAEAISREAGMSKATFYEHFANKEECILGLFDWARDAILAAMAEAAGATDLPASRPPTTPSPWSAPSRSSPRVRSASGFPPISASSSR